MATAGLSIRGRKQLCVFLNRLLDDQSHGADLVLPVPDHGDLLAYAWPLCAVPTPCDLPLPVLSAAFVHPFAVGLVTTIDHEFRPGENPT